MREHETWKIWRIPHSAVRICIVKCTFIQCAISDKSGKHSRISINSLESGVKIEIIHYLVNITTVQLQLSEHDGTKGFG